MKTPLSPHPQTVKQGFCPKLSACPSPNKRPHRCGFLLFEVVRPCPSQPGDPNRFRIAPPPAPKKRLWIRPWLVWTFPPFFFFPFSFHMLFTFRFFPQDWFGPNYALRDHSIPSCPPMAVRLPFLPSSSFLKACQFSPPDVLRPRQ